MKIKLLLRKPNHPDQTLEISEFPFTIGRADKNNLALDDQHISREHSRLDWIDEKLVVTKVSKAGKLLFDGKDIHTQALTLPAAFEIPPYSLSIEAVEVVIEPTSAATEEVVESLSIVEEPEEDSFPVILEDEEESIDDETKITSHQIKAKLILLKGLSPHESYDLMGQELILGRENECDIFLDDEKISRRHARIFLKGTTYYIEDLKSTNGVDVNQHHIKKATALTSSDQIQIGDCLLQFAIFDEDVFALSHSTQNSQLTSDTTYAGENHPQWDPNMPSYHIQKTKKSSTRRNILFAATSLMLLALLYIQLQPQSDPARQTAASEPIEEKQQKPQGELAKLTAVDRDYVIAKMNEAKDAYKNRQYRQAQISLQEALKIAPDHKPARDMIKVINQTLRQQARVDTQRQAQLEEQKLNEEIKLHLSVAFDYFNSQKWQKAIQEYDKILELNPGHEEAQQKRQASEQKLIVKPKIDPRIKAQKERNTNAEAFLAKGTQLAQKGKVLEALDAWRVVLKMENIEPQYYAKAEQFINFTKEQLDQKYFPLITQAEGLMEAKDYLQAKDILEKILKEHSTHAKAKKLHDRVLFALHGIAKKNYTEAIIDENVGRIESATEKFKWIIERIPANDEYHQKARRKLNKYE